MTNINFQLIHPVPDERDRAGRLYSRAVLEKAVKEFQKAITKRHAFVCIKPLDNSFTSYEESAAAVITNMYVGDKRIEVEVELLDNARGQYMEKVLPHRQGLFGALLGLGNLSDDLEVSDFIIHCVVDDAPQDVLYVGGDGRLLNPSYDSPGLKKPAEMQHFKFVPRWNLSVEGDNKQVCNVFRDDKGLIIENVFLDNWLESREHIDSDFDSPCIGVFSIENTNDLMRLLSLLWTKVPNPQVNLKLTLTMRSSDVQLQTEALLLSKQEDSVPPDERGEVQIDCTLVNEKLLQAMNKACSILEDAVNDNK